MSKSDMLTLLVGAVAVVIGYLVTNPHDANQLVNWLRHEIRTELPDPGTMNDPIQSPTAPAKLL